MTKSKVLTVLKPIYREITITANGCFGAIYKAEAALRDAGFSIGSMQAGSPRGIMWGNHFQISKWRNLDTEDIKALHGEMLGSRGGPVTIQIFHSAPDEALRAIDAIAEEMK